MSRFLFSEYGHPKLEKIIFYIKKHTSFRAIIVTQEVSSYFKNPENSNLLLNFDGV